MKTADIARWISYWSAASTGVNVDEIRSLSDVETARKFCPVMRRGRFCADMVSDQEIWAGIQTHRNELEAA